MPYRTQLAPPGHPGRRPQRHAPIRSEKFQSTPRAGGDSPRKCSAGYRQGFNPRPRAGGDVRLGAPMSVGTIVSIPPPRWGRPPARARRRTPRRFNPRPAHGATARSPRGTGSVRFQSPPPRRGRPTSVSVVPGPFRGRPNLVDHTKSWVLCFNPAPAQGATRRRAEPVRAVAVSIPAPAQGATRLVGRILRRSLRFLDEAVQQDHLAMRDAEDHPRDSPARDVTPDFPDPLAQRPANRHPDGPVEFDLLDVGADDPTMVRIESSQATIAERNSAMPASPWPRSASTQPFIATATAGQ
jgi:hypothetical protein